MTHTKLWETVLLSVLHAMPEKNLKKLWKQTEQPGAVFVLEIGRRQARSRLGFDITSRAHVQTPLKFGIGQPRPKAGGKP